LVIREKHSLHDCWLLKINTGDMIVGYQRETRLTWSLVIRDKHSLHDRWLL